MAPIVAACSVVHLVFSKAVLKAATMVVEKDAFWAQRKAVLLVGGMAQIVAACSVEHLVFSKAAM